MSEALASVGDMTGTAASVTEAALAAGARSAGAAGPILDEAQREVLALPPGVHAAVLGAPGSGKTTALVELFAQRLQTGALRPEEVLVLAPSRLSAAGLRDRLTLRAGAALPGAPARTPVSVALAVCAAARAASGGIPPRLLTGARQDELLREWLAGEAEVGDDGYWPPQLGRVVRSTRGFRDELRQFLDVCARSGLPSGELRLLAERHGRPEWAAALRFVAEEYLPLLPEVEPGALSAAAALEEATQVLEAVRRGALPAEHAGGWPALRLVLVDDAQDLAPGAIRLLGALARCGADVVAFGDPDAGTSAFLGGRPEVLGGLARHLGAEPERVRTLVLGRVHRHGPALRAAVSAVAGRIGAAAGGRQRAAGSAPGAPGSAAPEYRVAASEAQQARFVAERLRRLHLLEGVPWSQLAVVTRQRSRATELSRRLAALEVPTRVLGGGRELSAEPMVRALLAAARLAVGDRELDEELARELLLGPLGGYSPVSLRRLLRALRDAEPADTPRRGEGELLVEALASPGEVLFLDRGSSARLSRLLSAVAAARAKAAAGGSAEDVLWEIWAGAARPEAWAQAARGGASAGDDANRLLDAVVALQFAARRFAEREPEVTASAVLARLAELELAEDSLAALPSGDAVLVTTPQGIVGHEVHTVILAGVQDGVWPNLRPRGELLSTGDFAKAVTGGDPGPAADVRRSVLDDERRLLLVALSRARRAVVVLAVSDEENAPSAFLPEQAPPVRLPPGEGLSLAARVGEFRRALTGEVGSGASHASVGAAALAGEAAGSADRPPRERAGLAGGEERAAAAALLAMLARAGVPGADPAEWYGIAEPSSTAPLYNRDASGLVRISPSSIEAFESSPLEWLIQLLSASAPSSDMAVGTVLHRALELADRPEEIDALVERWWTMIPFDSEWSARLRRARLDRQIELLKGYLRRFAAEGGVLVASERGFELRLSEEGSGLGREDPGDADGQEVGASGRGVVLRGTVDRIELRRGEDGVLRRRLVDLKSGRLVSQADAEEHRQLASYQLALACGALDAPEDPPQALQAPADDPVLLYLPDTARAAALRSQPVLDESGLEQTRERILAIAAAMSAAEFPGPVEVTGEDDRRRLSRIHTLGAVSEG